MKTRWSSKEMGSEKEEAVKVTAIEVDFHDNIFYVFCRSGV